MSLIIYASKRDKSRVLKGDAWTMFVLKEWDIVLNLEGLPIAQANKTYTEAITRNLIGVWGILKLLCS